jgi:hypothetical protein
VQRRLLNALTALSLLLCIATLSFWVRGYWAADYLAIMVKGRIISFDSAKGRVALARWTTHSEVPYPLWSSAPASEADGDEVWRFERKGMGFGLVTDDPAPFMLRVVAVPDWLPVVLFALLPGWHLLRRRERLADRRTQLGLCPTCGYDLRATPTRCPECGTKIIPPPRMDLDGPG